MKPLNPDKSGTGARSERLNLDAIYLPTDKGHV